MKRSRNGSASRLIAMCALALGVLVLVGCPPTIGLNPASLSFDQPGLKFSAVAGRGNPQSAKVAINNLGTGTISGLNASVSYLDGSGWLQEPVSLSSTTAPTTMTVQPLTSSLTVGVYHATLSVAGNAINSPVTLDVKLSINASLTAFVSPSGTGTVTLDPPGGVYESGTSVTLRASPSPGFAFSRWSGDASGTSASVTVTVTRNLSITASFTALGSGMYSVTAAPSPSSGGTVALNPPGGSYTSGTQVALTASANAGYVFSSWSGDASGTSTSVTVTVTKNLSITANFTVAPPTNYSVTTAASPSGYGTVSLSPPGGSYASGSQVTLTASANAGYVFSSWSGDASGTSTSVTVTVTKNVSITANFTVAPPTNYSIVASGSPAGYGAVSLNPPGGSYASGTQVTLTANAYTGHVFTSWSGDTSGTSTSVTVTVTKNLSITANFAVVYYTLSTSVASGSGSISPSSGSYAYGTPVSLTAYPSTGYDFGGWSGDASGGSNPTTVTMTKSMSVSASFNVHYYQLSTSVSPAGGGSVSPSSGSYTYGSQVTLTAYPESGYVFTGWSGGFASSSNPVTVTAYGDLSVAANFRIPDIVVSATLQRQNGSSYGGGYLVAFDSTNTAVASSLTDSSGYAALTLPGGKTYTIAGFSKSFGTTAGAASTYSSPYGELWVYGSTSYSIYYTGFKRVLPYASSASRSGNILTVTVTNPSGISFGNVNVYVDFSNTAGGSVLGSSSATHSVTAGGTYGFTFDVSLYLGKYYDVRYVWTYAGSGPWTWVTTDSGTWTAVP